MLRVPLILGVIVCVLPWALAQDEFDVVGGTVEGAFATGGQGTYNPNAGAGFAPVDPAFGAPGIASDFGFPGQAPPPATPAIPLENRITVLRGAWVLDAVTRATLDVPELAQDVESNKGQYFNDGVNGGDVIANDEIWSRVETIDSRFIGPETHRYILYYINMFRLLHEMDPLSFAAVAVATPDPVSPLGQLDDYEAHQDTKILEWNERMLRDFRQADPITGEVGAQSPFYPIFVPAPPYYRPIAPDSLTAAPPLDFLQQCWIGFNGGTMDPNAVYSVRGSANPQGGQFGPPGVGGGELFGGEAGAEFQGQSSYIGGNQNTAVQQQYSGADFR